MPRFSTRRPVRPRSVKVSPPNKSTPRQRMLTCLFLPVWLLVVVNAHVAIGFFQELDESVLVDPVELTQETEEVDEIPPGIDPFQEETEPTEEEVVEATVLVPKQEMKQDFIDGQIAQKFFIEPDANGDVFGRLTTLGDDGMSPIGGRCQVALVQGGKEIVKATATDGEFLLQNVPTGTGSETYTLVVSGNKGFLAQTINVGRPANDQSSYRTPTLRADYVSLKQEFDIPDGQNDLPDLVIDPVQSAIAPVAPVTPVVPQSYQLELVAMQPRYSSLEKMYQASVSEDTGIVDFDYGTRPERADLQTAACYEYELNDEGGFCGRLIIPDGDLTVREFTDMKVFLNQGSQQVAEAIVEINGDFEFTGVSAGSYGLIAAGSEGFAAVPVSLVNNVGPVLDETGQTDKPADHYVALQDEFDPCGCCRVPLVCQPQDVQYVGDVIGDWNVPQVVRNGNFPGPLPPSPIEFQGVASGGFAPPSVGPAFSGGFAAPAAPVVSGGGFAAPAAGGGFGGGGGLLSGIGSSRLARLGLVGGIIAIAVSGDGDEDLPVSPSDL